MEQDRDGITVSKILQFADLRDKEVLEIGCGDGRITSQLVEKTKRLVAIDPDAENIAEAKENMSGVDLRIGYGEEGFLCYHRFKRRVFLRGLGLSNNNHRDTCMNLI